MTGDQIGTIVGIIFGTAWAIAGATALQKPAQIIAFPMAMAIGGVLIAVALQSPAAPGTRFNGTIYGAVVLLEVVAITACANYLTHTGRKTFVPPALATIVGLHFVGMWLATERAVFLWTAAALCCVGLLAAFARPALRLPAAGFGSAVVLWVAAASAFI